jgi:DNA gyrase/topoisomerase IV subunit B
MKGLGEMDADELWDTTMNPNNRNIIKVTMDDYDKTFDTMEELFNAKFTDKRKELLLNN